MIAPITNRVAGAHMSYIDMDRIVRNLNELAIIMNSRGYMIPTGLKSGYQRDDILVKSEWDMVVAIATAIEEATNFDIPIGNDLVWENMNNIERLTARTALAMEQMVHYVCGDASAGAEDDDPALEMIKASKLPTTVYYVCGEITCGNQTEIGGNYG